MRHLVVAALVLLFSTSALAAPCEKRLGKLCNAQTACCDLAEDGLTLLHCAKGHCIADAADEAPLPPPGAQIDTSKLCGYKDGSPYPGRSCRDPLDVCGPTDANRTGHVVCHKPEDEAPTRSTTTTSTPGATVTSTSRPSSTTTTTRTTTSRPPTTTTTRPGERLSAPCRTNYRTISIKRPLTDIYTFDDDGRLLTQKGRSCMQDMMLLQAVPETSLLLRGVPSCRVELPGMVVGDLDDGKVNAQTTRLQVRCPYRDPLQCFLWTIGLSGPGRAYGFEGDLLHDAAACLLKHPVECAAVFEPLPIAAVFGVVVGPGAETPTIHYARPDLLDLYDLKIVNGRCVKGADFAIPVLTEPFDARVGQEAPLDGRLRIRVDTADLVLLQAADDAHRCGSEGRSGCPSVKAAQEAYVAAGRTETERYMREIRPFIGGCDPAYDAETCRKWKILEHHFYHIWISLQRAGALWGEAETFGATPHGLVHDCAKTGADPNLHVLLPCGDDPKTGRPFKMSQCINEWKAAKVPLTCKGYLESPIAQAILAMPTGHQ